MMIIVSTRGFAQIISSAIAKNATRFAIVGTGRNFRIYHEKNGCEYVLAHHVEPKIGDANKKLEGKFNPVTWYKLREFLRQLPEQPICITFNDYGDDDIEIQLSQFIMEFK